MYAFNTGYYIPFIHPNSNLESSSLLRTGNSHTDGEKTFAIIIGLLAGVALVIIFLTFLKKVFGGHGTDHLYLTFFFPIFIRAESIKLYVTRDPILYIKPFSFCRKIKCKSKYAMNIWWVLILDSSSIHPFLTLGFTLYSIMICFSFCSANYFIFR